MRAQRCRWLPQPQGVGKGLQRVGISLGILAEAVRLCQNSKNILGRRVLGKGCHGVAGGGRRDLGVVSPRRGRKVVCVRLFEDQPEEQLVPRGRYW